MYRMPVAAVDVGRFASARFTLMYSNQVFSVYCVPYGVGFKISHFFSRITQGIMSKFN